jgi:apolipoprotein D and lipocalin family protein
VAASLRKSEHGTAEPRLTAQGRSEANAGDQRRTETIEIGLRLPSVGVKLISWHDISFERISIFPAPLLKGQSDYAKEDYRHRANWGSTTSGSLRIHPSTPVGNRAVPQPARSVSLNKYMGRWYEQFRYEASFERDMDDVTAEYSLNDDGTVKVINRGRKSCGSGDFRQSVGKAKIADPTTNAKLKVSFFGPFYGNYWVLDQGLQGPGVLCASVPIGSDPTARRRSSNHLARLEARVRALGYDWSLVRVTKQSRSY